MIVSDTGIGIYRDRLESLFDPFTQGDESYRKQFKGAGLGLAISKEIVSLMGGTISVKSEPGVGSEFSVCLPFQSAHASAVGTAQASCPEPKAGSQILVVEDDKVSSLSACKMLESMGLEVTTAGDGEMALNILKEKAFDLVLMDVQLPVMDGKEATQAIRAGRTGEGNRKVPIVAMTAYAMAGDRERIIASGMDGYVSKPIDMDSLKKAIAKYL